MILKIHFIDKSQIYFELKSLVEVNKIMKSSRLKLNVIWTYLTNVCIKA